MRRKVLWVFGILVILCPCSICGVGYFTIRSWFTGPAEALPREMQLAKRDGIPLEPADLRPNPPVPDDQNAAKIYSSFFPHLDKVKSKYKDAPNAIRNFLKDKATSAEATTVHQILTESRESLYEIATATKRPFCDFHYRYEEGFRLRLPEFAQFKGASQLLLAKAHDLGRQGKLAEAFDLVARDEALARHAGSGPMVIAKLVEISMENAVAAEFCNLLQMAAQDSAQLARAQRTLDSFGPLADLRTAFGGEVVLGRIAIHQIHTWGDLRALSKASSDETYGSDQGSGPVLPDWFLKGTESNFVATWRAVIEAIPNDPNEWEKASAVLEATDRKIANDQSLNNLLVGILFPVLAQAPLAVGAEQANRRIAATSLRLLQDRLRTGSLPAILPAYGAMALDPFDGKPLRYRREGTGFTIYSIDRDRTDNGGQVKKSGSNGDIVRSFKLPARH